MIRWFYDVKFCDGLECVYVKNMYKAVHLQHVNCLINTWVFAGTTWLLTACDTPFYVIIYANAIQYKRVPELFCKNSFSFTCISGVFRTLQIFSHCTTTCSIDNVVLHVSIPLFATAYFMTRLIHVLTRLELVLQNCAAFFFLKLLSNKGNASLYIRLELGKLN